MKYLFNVICFCFLITNSFCQNTQSVFKHLDASSGLSNNWVRSIYMDETGFMWFGTADGLNRYDGHQFKAYRPQTAKGNNIGNINVSDILRKSATELWVCTDLGVYVFNYPEDRMDKYEPLQGITANCIYITRNGKCWVGSNSGLYCLDEATGHIDIYTNRISDSTSISDNSISALYEDTDGKLWVGTKRGLSVFDTLSRTFKNYLTDYPSSVMAIKGDRMGRIWIADQLNGLLVGALKSGSMHFEKITGGQILEIRIDSKNRLWIGKGSGGGLYRMDLNNYIPGKKVEMEYFHKVPLNSRSLSENSIVSIYEDSFQDIWVGTFGKGVNYYSERAKKFNIINDNANNRTSIGNNLVNAIYEDDDYLYIGTEGGLDVYNKRKGYFDHFQNEPGNPLSLAANAVFTIYKDSKKRIWVGTWGGGLHRFYPETRTFKRYLPDGNPGSISSGNIFSIFEDNRGILWIATIGGGVNVFNEKNETFRTYLHDNNNPGSLYGNLVNHIYQTSDGKLYFSIDNALDLYDYKNDRFIHYKHDVKDPKGNFGNILSVFEDSRKNLWIATNAGLEYFKEKDKTFIPIKGLRIPDHTIQGILEDNRGNLWISTNKGIAKITDGINFTGKMLISTYSSADGLSGDEFKKRAAFKNKEGIMYFGSSQGLTYFHPDSIKQNKLAPNVILSDLMVLNARPEDKGKYQDLRRHINNIQVIELPYKHADFEIAFAALNYLNPQDNSFRYILEGYNKNWIDADHVQSARYTNLNHGRYVFKVAASNNDGIWCTVPRTLIIEIHPPFWNTLLFRIGVFLLLSALIGGLFRLRVRMLKNQKTALENTVNERTHELIEINHLLEQKQEEITNQLEELSRYKNHLETLVEERTADLTAAKEKAEESDRLKTSFLQNMSHEIRTPLNAIMGFSDLLNDTLDDNTKIIKYSSIIKQKGVDLLDIINEILDISKIESGSFKVNMEYFDLGKLMIEIEQYYPEFQKRLKKEHLNFVIRHECNEEVLKIYSDKIKLKQVITNLIGNAFKFTETGSVEFGCRLGENSTLLFYVSDTGPGIPSDKFDVIFERFRQVDELHYHEGAGLGLSICKGIVKLLGGNISLTSEIDKGTTFTFTIPLK